MDQDQSLGRCSRYCIYLTYLLPLPAHDSSSPLHVPAPLCQRAHRLLSTTHSATTNYTTDTINAVTTTSTTNLIGRALLQPQPLCPLRLPRPLPVLPLLFLAHPTDHGATRPNAFTIPPEHERDRHEHHLQQSQQRTRPLGRQRRVHGRSCERQRRAEQGPHHGVSCECRRSEVAVGRR